MSNVILDVNIITKCLNLPFMQDGPRFFVRLNEEQDMVLFKPSQNIQDAWLALEKFDGDFIALRQKSSNAFECEIIHKLSISKGYGTTPSLAICSAIAFAADKLTGGN